MVASGRARAGRPVPSFLHLSQAWREHIKRRRGRRTDGRTAKMRGQAGRQAGNRRVREGKGGRGREKSQAAAGVSEFGRNSRELRGGRDGADPLTNGGSGARSMSQQARRPRRLQRSNDRDQDLVSVVRARPELHSARRAVKVLWITGEGRRCRPLDSSGVHRGGRETDIFCLSTFYPLVLRGPRQAFGTQILIASRDSWLDGRGRKYPLETLAWVHSRGRCMCVEK